MIMFTEFDKLVNKPIRRLGSLVGVVFFSQEKLPSVQINVENEDCRRAVDNETSLWATAALNHQGALLENERGGTAVAFCFLWTELRGRRRSNQATPGRAVFLMLQRWTFYFLIVLWWNTETHHGGQIWLPRLETVSSGLFSWLLIALWLAAGALHWNRLSGCLILQTDDMKNT